MTLRIVRWVVVLFTFALIAGPAQAQGKRETGQKLTEQGRRAYNLGHWSDALTDFEKAYEISGNAALLFNLAETHRQLGHAADALRLYNAYLRELPNGPEHEAAATEIKNLGGTTAAKAPPQPRPATSPPPVTTAPAKPAPPAVVAKPAPPAVVAKPAPPAVVAKPAPPAVVAKPAPPPAVVAKPAPPPAVVAKPAPPPAVVAKPAPPPAAAKPPSTPPPVATATAKPATSTPPPAPPAASNIAPAPIAPIAPASPGATAPPVAMLPAAGPPTLVSQPPPPASHRSKWPAIVGGAATGAFAVGAIAFTVSGNHLYDDLKASCGNTTMGCTQGQIDGVKTRDHAATAFWILAGAAAVATSVLLVVRF